MGALNNGSDFRVYNSKFNHNGQQGINANLLSDSEFIGNETSHNNQRPEKRFSLGFEAGGNKFTRTTNLLLESHISTNNRGHGIWFDINNQYATITKSKSFDNLSGIHYELSYKGRIFNNFFYDNNDVTGNDNFGMGVFIAASAHCQVYNNTIYGNDDRGVYVKTEGLSRDTKGTDDPTDDTWTPSVRSIVDDGESYQVTSYANQVYNNIIYDNGKSSTDAGVNQYQIDLSYETQTQPDWLNDLHPDFPFALNVSQNNYFSNDTSNGRFFAVDVFEKPNDGITVYRQRYVRSISFTDWKDWTDGPQVGGDGDLNSKFTSVSPFAIDPYDDLPDPTRGLNPTSTAINAGRAVSLVTEDYRGVKRPQGGTIDMGAFEYTRIVEAKDDASETHSTGDVFRESADAHASGGTATFLEANADGDFVTFEIGNIEMKTYDVYVRVKTGPNRGKFDFSVAGTGGYTTHEEDVDLYTTSTTVQYKEFAMGSITFTEAGTKFFRFEVDMKNPESSGFWLAIDYIRLEEK